MKFTAYHFAVKHLQKKPFRTAILIFSICIIVAMVVFALLFTYRIKSGINKMSARLGADIIVVPTGSRGLAEDILLENKVKTVYMDSSVLNKIKKIDGIERLTTQTYMVSLTGLCCGVPETTVVAFNQETDFIVKPWLKKDFKSELQIGEALVGADSALNIEQGLVDMETMIFGNIFKMVGLLEKTGTGLDSAIFISDKNIDSIIKHGQSSLRKGQISVIFIKAKSEKEMKKIADEIEDNIVEVDAVVRKDIGKGIVASLRDINAVFLLSSVITSILAALLAWAVFSAIVNERLKEIGIMRAIGARDSDLSLLFIIEVLAIGIIGSLIGIIIGNLMAEFSVKSFTILKNISTGIDIYDRTLISTIGVFAGNLICIAGAFAPLQRLKKIEPLTAIKGE